MEPQKRNGKWYQRVAYYDYNDLDKTGKPKRKFTSKQGFNTKREAKQWAADFISDLNKGLIKDYKSIPKFSDYFLNWAEIYRYPTISGTTKKTYENVHKHIEKYFGAQKINQITRANYQQFLNEFCKDHAPITVSKLKGLIHACLDSAVADRIIDVNFSLGAVGNGNKENVKRVIYPSIKEIMELLKVTKKNLNPNVISKYMILTGIATGMRIGETGGITWDCINFEKNEIKIEKAYRYKSYEPIYKNDPRFKPLKNQSSARTIRVSKNFLDILSQLKVNNNEMVFASPINNMVPTPNACDKEIKYLVRKQLKKDWGNFRFHSLRHCQVALLRYYGVDWYAISKRLGHANLATTLKEYAYLADEEKIKNDNLIEKKIDKLF